MPRLYTSTFSQTLLFFFLNFYLCLNFWRKSYEGVESSVEHACNAPSVSLLSLLLKLNLGQGDASCSQPLCQMKPPILFDTQLSETTLSCTIGRQEKRKMRALLIWDLVCFLILTFTFSFCPIGHSVCVTIYNWTTNWGGIKTVTKFQQNCHSVFIGQRSPKLNQIHHSS